MTISLTNTKSRFDEAMTVSDQVVRMTITGVDVKGQMFRHSATVLLLDGCDCAFLSESQPELDGSILVEFDYPQADPKRRLSQGRVKSNHAEIDSGLYKVVVELETAQTVKVIPNRIEPQTAVKQPALPPIPASGAEGKGDPAIAPREFLLPPDSNGIPQALPRPKNENSATVKFESRELLPKTQAEDPIAVREAIKSAVASEIKQQIHQLRSWISSELEKVVPLIVSSNMEKMICEAVEKHSANCQISNQDLYTDVARQVGDRIAESDDLRTALESMAKKLFEEQTELSRTAGAKVEQELSSRATTIIQSFEESIAEVQARINNVRAEIEGALTRAQTVKEEVKDSMLLLQESLQQLNNAERTGIEEFQRQAAAQLGAGAAQFENQLNKISAERAVQFAVEMEQHLAPYRQRADETVEKLGAVLQLVQGTARVQQERLTEHSRTTAANFEKEIRALLLRLGGGA